MTATTYRVATVDIDGTGSSTSVTLNTFTEALDQAKEWDEGPTDLDECGMKVQVSRVQDGTETILFDYSDLMGLTSSI